MANKYIPPSLRNKESSVTQEAPMSRNSAFSRPKKQSNSSYWAARHREEDAAAKRESDAAAQSIIDNAKFNETNFPSMMSVQPKTTGWTGAKFSEIAAQSVQENVDEKKTEDSDDKFELPVFPKIRRVRRFPDPQHQEYYEDGDDYYNDETSADYSQDKNPEDSLDGGEETGDGWVEVRPKIKIRREKTLEEKYPEEDETVWDDDQEEEESCWDSRGRKLKH